MKQLLIAADSKIIMYIRKKIV